MAFGTDVGIDLGTATVLIYVKGKGIVLNEPSVVAVDKANKIIKKVGIEAQQMLGRAPGAIEPVRPLKDGVISDYDLTEKMIKYFLRKVLGNTSFWPRIMVCVPSSITEVEILAVRNAVKKAGARHVYIIEEPIAAAIGAGIDIARPCGNMVVDIGGGTTDIAVILLGGVANKTSIKIAGDRFDEALIKYIRRKFNVLIGDRTAQDTKEAIGCVYMPREVRAIPVKGRCLMTGLPKTIEVNSEDMLYAFEEPANAISDAVCRVLEGTEPELVADISKNKIHLTGGGSLVGGLADMLTERTGIQTVVAEDAVSCVVRGTGIALENERLFSAISHNALMSD
ncbi:MAG: rod shape-determining protein [Clostridia bacterium]|nr:rod shape-determining protein [Clostridia bacterium]